MLKESASAAAGKARRYFWIWSKLRVAMSTSTLGIWARKGGGVEPVAGWPKWLKMNDWWS